MAFLNNWMKWIKRAQNLAISLESAISIVDLSIAALAMLLKNKLQFALITENLTESEKENIKEVMKYLAEFEESEVFQHQY